MPFHEKIIIFKQVINIYQGAFYTTFHLGMRIRSDPLIFGQPDPLLFSLDRDPDPTFNNGYIKLFPSLTKYKPES